MDHRRINPRVLRNRPHPEKIQHDRIRDLQEVLIPNTDPGSMALENAVRINSPLRLKRGGRQDAFFAPTLSRI
jgi:hypothetical protein